MFQAFFVAIKVEAVDDEVETIGKEMRPCFIGSDSRSVELTNGNKKFAAKRSVFYKFPYITHYGIFNNWVVCSSVTARCVQNAFDILMV